MLEGCPLANTEKSRNSLSYEVFPMRNKMNTITIRDSYIELYKILKRENMAASGGEAKFMIIKGLVLVNGAVEFRKRRKTVVGDVVECNGQRVMIVEK